MAPLRRVKLTDLNAHLVCVLCSGYFVDATTIIECLHTFCKTCIVRYLQTSSFCPICDVQVHKTKPLLSLREDRTLQDVVFKLVPGLFQSEMNRRLCFYKEHPEAGGDKTEQSLRERRHFFHVDDQISLSLEYLPSPPSVSSHLHSVMKPLKVNNGQQEKQKTKAEDDKDGVTGTKEKGETEEQEGNSVKMIHKRYLRCPAAVQVSHLEKFIRAKYCLASQTHKVDIMHGGDCLVGELTLLDVVYMYKWTEDAPLRLTYTVTATPQSRKRARLNGTRASALADSEAPSIKIPRTQVPAVLPSPPKGQDVPVDKIKVTPVDDSGNGSEVKEEASDQAKVKSSNSNAVSKIVSTSAMNTGALLFSQSHSILSTASLVGTSCNVKHLSNSAPARSRSAITTTTPATATPRVALARLPPSQVNLSSGISVCIPASEPPSTSTSSAIAHSNLGMASSARMQMPQPALNGVVEGAMKAVRSSIPHMNKMPQPIIPTRPRLGRPPNSSRINAANMKVPVPRLRDVRNPRPPLSLNKKMFPSGAANRANQTVSATLNVQSRLSSISGPPVKVGASKVTVKRPNDVLKDGGQKPDQPDDQVKKQMVSPSSLPTNTTVATDGSQANHCSKNLPVSESPATLSTATSSQGHEASVTKSDSAANQKTDTQALQRPADGQRHQSTPTGQRPSAQSVQRPASQASQRANNQANLTPPVAPLRPTGPQALSAQRPPGTPVGQRPSGNQAVQRLPGAQAGPRAPGTQANQRPVSQQQPPAANAKQRQQSQPLADKSSGTQQGQQSSGIQSRQTSPAVPAVQKPVNPVAQRLTNISSTQRQPNASVNQRPPASSASSQRPTLSSPRPPGSPAPHTQPSSPSPHLQSASPAPHLKPGSPAPHLKPGSPAPHLKPGSPAPTKQPSIPVSQRPPSSPAPHRQPVNTTPRPPSALTTTPTTKSSTSPSSTSPKTATSSPSSTSTVSITPNNRETSPAVSSTSANTSSVAGLCSPSNHLNGKASGSKSGTSHTQPRAGHVQNSQNAKASSAKSQSSTGGKASPKSPGRGRGSAESSTILKVLANRELQQRFLARAVSSSNTATATTITPSSPVGTQDGFTNTAPGNTVYPAAMGSGSVSPALAAVAYMATAYGDTSLADAAMRNLITLSQTAACIREFNLASSLVQHAETMPRSSDPAPIDLSPTSKAAPQSPLTNGRAQTSTTPVTKTAVSHTSKSPSSKTPRLADPSGTPTISPPTPEVTITKLPNTPASTSTQSSSTGTGKNAVGSAKLGSTNTNTVSITKRPASNNRIAVAKSPANASVRQIPNPSLLRHQSEARNNNVSKASPSVASTSSPNTSIANTTTSSKTHSSAKQSSAGGRATGNSPLKETGPLPETSSILKIEHLTRSLPAPAAAASHALRFFDDR